VNSTSIHVCVVLGTRPEAIKLAPVIQCLRQSSEFVTTVILTGQHREMVDQVMALFEIKADQDLAIMRPKQSLTQITCDSLAGLEKLFVNLTPDLVLVQGDTTTALAAALAAFYHRIPVGHVEAGLRTDDLFNPFPEEANRRLISQIAQLHFAPTPAAAQNLRNSQVIGAIHMTGNTVIDALLYVAELPTKSGFPEFTGLPELADNEFRVILATLHRRENWGAPLERIAQAWLEILDRCADVALLLPLHLNPTVREPLQALLQRHPRVFLVEPLSYGELVRAMQHCYLVMTDSGGLQEEAPSLGKPVLVLRDTTERPEAIAAGTAKLVGTETAVIVEAAMEILNDSQKYAAMAHKNNPFGDGKSSQRIRDLILDYFDQSPSKSSIN
jgi:UDP-N-acetylglucosamine 2-epimerase (non-hydrolysing)